MSVSIVSLRDRQNQLAARFAAVASAIRPMFSLTAPFTEVLAHASHEAWGQNFGWMDNPGDPPEYQTNVRKQVPILSYDFLFPIIRDDVAVRNLLAAWKAIGNLALDGPPVIDSKYLRADLEPVQDLWTPEEITLIGRSYKNRITDAVKSGRDIHTYWKMITRLHCPMPEFIKSSLLEMFGGPDHAGFTYSEDDFQPAYCLRTKDKKPPAVMTARWLAPFTGAEHAKAIEQALNVVEEQFAPRRYEPPTLDHFSSHTSNAIKVFADLME